MAEFERGDVVVYCYHKAPEWHGTLAIVDRWEPKYYPRDPTDLERSGQDCYPVYIRDFITCAPGFPYTTGINTEPWLAEAWEKVGHIDLPTG